MRSALAYSVATILMLVHSVAIAVPPNGVAVPDDSHAMSGWMMAACMLFGVLGLIALVLAIFALLKYLRSSREPKR